MRLMQLLVEMEPMKLVWYGHPHNSWKDVLLEERLCTFTAFNAWKKAVGFNIPVEMVGVSAACLLAKQQREVRTTVLRQTVAWVKTYQVPPNYQLVSEYVKKLMGDGKKKPAPSKLKEENAQLLRENTKLTEENEGLKKRIFQLESLLRLHKIRIPKD